MSCGNGIGLRESQPSWYGSRGGCRPEAAFYHCAPEADNQPFHWYADCNLRPPHLDLSIMKLWRGQPDNWKPQPLPIRNQIAIGGVISMLCLYNAASTWLEDIDPCAHSSVGHHCRLAKFWSNLFGISHSVADAQFWLALGVLCLVGCLDIWRKSKREDAPSAN
jgi:hypothetical protein